MSKPHRELTEREKLAKHAATAHAGGLLDFERTFRWAERRIEELEGALEWYAETVGKCRMIHKEGDDARNALHADCGNRACRILASANSRED